MLMFKPSNRVESTTRKKESVSQINLSTHIQQTEIEQYKKSVCKLMETNEKMENEIDRQLTELTPRVDKTHHEMRQLRNLTERMKQWTMKFFSNPQECSLEKILVMNEKYEQEDIIFSPLAPLSRADDIKTREQTGTTEDLEYLKMVYVEEEKYAQVLSEIRSNCTIYEKVAKNQEKNLKAMQSNSELSIQEWTTWQKKMIGYLTRARKNYSFDIEQVVSVTETMTYKSDLEEVNYAPKK